MAKKPIRLGLTRDQFASFLNDFEQIKQFENLFSAVDTISNSSIDEVTISAGNAEASANEALAGIENLKELVEFDALAPAIQNNTSETTNYIDFITTLLGVAPRIGRIFWDGGQTLNIQQTLNVAGKVNEDNYYYIKADSTISKGQLIMFTGAIGASGVLRGAPATGLGINDGILLMGIAAENIATNDFGLVQWSGVLRGFNTTGSPYGETWVDGDILYYNPAYAGGLTNVEPTAPNVRAVIAAVVNAGSGGSGSVAIRIIAGSVLGGTDSNVYINGLTAGDLLQYDGVDQRWENHAPSTVSVGTATNLAGGSADRIPYQTGAGATSFIVAPTSANTFLEWSGSAFQWSSNPLGTVTSVSVVTANGLAGTVANATTTPAITLSTTVTGLVKGNGTAFSAASSGTDYVAPGAITTSGLTMGTARLLGRTTAATGAVEEISVAGGLTLSGGTLTSPSGTVTSVSGTGSVNGITLTGTVTSSGSLTLGGTLSNVSLTSQVTGTLPVGNGGTGVATLTSGYLLKGNGTSAVSASVVYDDGTNIVVGGTATGSSKFTVTGTSSGGQVVARINNTSGTANTQAVLSFDTSNNGFNVRDSQIRSTNNGSNQTTLEFYTANAAAPTSKMSISAAGVITAAGVYNNTVGATNRDVYVDNTGLIGYLPSVFASKTNIADLTDTGWVYDLHPVSFNYRKRDDSGAYTDEAETPVEYGLIAEEVETVNPQLVFYDETPVGLSLRGVSYSKLIIPMLAELQALRARVDELERNSKWQ